MQLHRPHGALVEPAAAAGAEGCLSRFLRGLQVLVGLEEERGTLLPASAVSLHLISSIQHSVWFRAQSPGFIAFPIVSKQAINLSVLASSAVNGNKPSPCLMWLW